MRGYSFYHKDVIVSDWSSVQRSGHSLQPLSGVKVTHLPTGIQATAENHRSQHMNREVAFQRLDFMLKEKSDEH